MKSGLTRYAPFALIAALPFFFYWKLFTPNPEERLIFRGDFLNQHYVWKSYALERVGRGELPLWNPHILGGVAFHGNPQVGIFYPPTYLLLLFHEEGKVDYLALETYQLLHQAWGGAGMYLLVRSLGVSSLGALFAALTFMFTGFFTTPGHHAIVLTASWIPWVLHGMKRVLARGDLRGIPLLSLLVASMALAGHPQIAYFGLLLASVVALAAFGIRRSATHLLPAIVLGLGLAAVQIVPTYAQTEDSNRSDVGYDYSTTFGFSPYFLGAALAPRGQIPLAGQDGSAPLHLYAGVGTLLLAAIGTLLSEHKWRWILLGVALGSLFLSMGEDSVLYDLFYLVLPGFRSFRIPFRLLGLYTISVAILAGLGIDVLARAGFRARRRLRGVARGAFGALIVIAFWVVYVSTQFAVDPGNLGAARMERVVDAANWAFLLALVNFLVFLLVLWRPKERFLPWVFLVVLAIDLGAFVKDRGQHPYRTLQRAEERPVHRLLRAQSYRSRYVTESNLDSYAMLYGTESAGGHASLVDRRYEKLLARSHESANALAVLNAKFIVRGGPVRRFPWCGERSTSALPLLDIPAEMREVRFSFPSPVETTSVRFYWRPLAAGGRASIELEGETYPLPGDGPLEVLFEEPTRLGEFRVVQPSGSAGIELQDLELDLNPLGLKADFMEVEGIKINLHALPRVYFMEPSDVPSEVQTLESLSCWTIHRGVQVQSPETGEGATGFFRRDVARITRYESEEVEIETRSPRDGFVVLGDTFRPGWVAYVDDVEVPIWRAHVVMRAVAVPRGEHRVRFLYRPPSLRVGALLSGLSLLVMGGLLFAPSILRRRSSETSPPSETSA